MFLICAMHLQLIHELTWSIIYKYLLQPIGVLRKLLTVVQETKRTYDAPEEALPLSVKQKPKRENPTKSKMCTRLLYVGKLRYASCRSVEYCRWRTWPVPFSHIGETVTNEVVSQRRFDTIILNYLWLQMAVKEKWV